MRINYTLDEIRNILLSMPHGVALAHGQETLPSALKTAIVWLWVKQRPETLNTLKLRQAQTDLWECGEFLETEPDIPATGSFEYIREKE